MSYRPVRDLSVGETSPDNPETAELSPVTVVPTLAPACETVVANWLRGVTNAPRAVWTDANSEESNCIAAGVRFVAVPDKVPWMPLMIPATALTSAVKVLMSFCVSACAVPATPATAPVVAPAMEVPAALRAFAMDVSWPLTVATI